MEHAPMLRRWRIAVAIATALLPVACGSARAATKIKVFVGSSSKTDSPAKAGQASSEAAAWASAMAHFVAEAFSATYPCCSTLTRADAGSVLQHEHDKELLGGDSEPNAMAALASAVGARYLANVSVTQSGGSSLVTVTLVDTRTEKVTSRQSQSIPVNQDAVEALDALAQKFVNSLGSAFPQCAAGDWKGTVTVEFIMDEQQRGVTKKGTGTLQCTLTGAGSAATCSLQGESTWTSGHGVMKFQTQGQATSASVIVSLNNGKLHLGLPQLKASTSAAASTNDGSGSVTNEEELDGGAYDVPASGDAKHQSGSWTQPGFQSSKVVVTWNLTRD